MFGRRFSSFSAWRLAAAVFFVGSTISLSALPSAAATDKILARVRGTVQYQTAGQPLKPIYTRLDVPDDAFAVTQAKSLATLTLPDSSQIDIGERTNVQIGEFNSVTSGKDNTITLKNGALHFVIRHPEGVNANYKFQTPTSQIAIRGTEGFLVQNAGGTSLTITSGTASITAISTGVTIAVPAGTTGVVSATGAATVSTTTSTLSVSSISGSSTATGGAAGGLAGSTTTAIAGGAAAAAGVVAATSTTTSNASPSPQGTPGPFLIGGSPVDGTVDTDVYATPNGHTFSSQTITQTNCVADATVSVSGPVTLTGGGTLTLPCTNGSLSGVVSGSFTGTGTAIFTITEPGSSVSATHTENIYGPLTVSIVGVSNSLPAADTITVYPISVTTVPNTIVANLTQAGPSTPKFASTLNCSNVATATNYASFIGLGSVGVFNAAGPSLTITVAAAPTYAAGTAPSTAPPYACLLTINGQVSSGNDGTTGSTGSTSNGLENASILEFAISVTTEGVSIQQLKRTTETLPGSRKTK